MNEDDGFHGESGHQALIRLGQTTIKTTLDRLPRIGEVLAFEGKGDEDVLDNLRPLCGRIREIVHSHNAGAVASAFTDSFGEWFDVIIFADTVELIDGGMGHFSDSKISPSR